MVLEGPVSQILAFSTFTCARDSTFAKYRYFSESCFSSKMCSFCVQNHKMLPEQMSICINVFGDDACAFPSFFLLPLNFYCWRNIFFCWVYSRCAQHTDTKIFFSCCCSWGVLTLVWIYCCSCCVHLRVMF